MEKETLKFPDGFLWGAATSSHQVEGNVNNDWSEWEKKNAKRLADEAPKKWARWQQEKFPEMFDPQNYISGRACDHYNRYEEDLDIAKSLGLNAFRISIEWSRIEPEEGKFDEKEIEHYRKVIEAIRERGMEPFVTLWHFTNPAWIEKIGGWENAEVVNHFLRYVEKLTKSFPNKIQFWIPFNEASSYTGHSYILGVWPPKKKGLWRTNKVLWNFSLAHRGAYQIIHDKIGKHVQVGSVYNLKFHTPYRTDNWLDKLLTKLSQYYRDDRMLAWSKGYEDFIGLNYYFRDTVKFTLGGKFFGLAEIRNPNENISDMGSDVYSKGVYYVIKRLKKYNLPIYITENGLADAKDTKRAKFIKDHLRWIHKAISEGADVRGYFHWSLLDNFEWDKGFWPRFGLVEMDYKTMKRKIRPSAYEYAKICKENVVNS